MRLTAVIPVVLALLVSALAGAQDLVEFASMEDRFTVTFPVAPTTTATTYTTQSGTVLPARLYAATAGRNRFTVLVADFTDIERIATEKAKKCPEGAEPCLGGLAPSSATGAGYWKADLAGALQYATWEFIQRDATITHFGWNSVDLVEANMMSLTNHADQSRTAVAMSMHENKLYILESTVPAGIPEPGYFQHSLGWIDAQGEAIRYETLYHNGFQKPAYRR